MANKRRIINLRMAGETTHICLPDDSGHKIKFDSDGVTHVNDAIADHLLTIPDFRDLDAPLQEELDEPAGSIMPQGADGEACVETAVTKPITPAVAVEAFAGWTNDQRAEFLNHLEQFLPKDDGQDTDESQPPPPASLAASGAASTVTVESVTHNDNFEELTNALLRERLLQAGVTDIPPRANKQDLVALLRKHAPAAS